MLNLVILQGGGKAKMELCLPLSLLNMGILVVYKITHRSIVLLLNIELFKIRKDNMYIKHNNIVYNVIIYF